MLGIYIAPTLPDKHPHTGSGRRRDACIHSFARLPLGPAGGTAHPPWHL